MDPFLARVLDIAASQIGVREEGRNRGLRVEEYQRAAGALPGDPWCAAFVCFCLRRAADEIDAELPHLTAGALKLWKYNPRAQRVDAAPGRVFVLDHGGGLGHVGFVEAPLDDGWSTIEGNTHTGGSRDGDGVYRNVRRFNALKPGTVLIGFLDFGTVGAAPTQEIA